MDCRGDTRGRRLLLALVVATVLSGGPVGAQATRAHVGLTASGGLGVFGGGGQATHDLTGGEAGALVDLGWIWSPRVRLTGDAAWFAGPHREFVAQDDRSYKSTVFDLTGSVSLRLLGGSASSRLVPYLSGGFAIHALSSSFGTLPLDQRYNANRFGVLGAVGMERWIGSSGRQSVWVEWRVQEVTDASRWTARVGWTRHFAAMARPR
ncbi:MAG: hypothetical protein U0132_18425 [Gemmatimonadaceae bacterium]